MLQLIYPAIFLTCVLVSIRKVSDISDLHCSKVKTLIVPAYDIFHSNFSCSLAYCYFLPDIILATAVALWFVNFTYDRFCISMTKVAIYALIRLLSVASTYGYVSPRYLLNLHITTGLNANFSDLIISGHVGITSIIAIDIFNFSGAILKCIAITLIILQSYVNLAVGDHYSSDIVLALAVALLIQNSTLI
jgi:hypothetical protein